MFLNIITFLFCWGMRAPFLWGFKELILFLLEMWLLIWSINTITKRNK